MLALRAAARRLRPAVNSCARAQRRCGHDGGHHEEAYLFGIVSLDPPRPRRILPPRHNTRSSSRARARAQPPGTPREPWEYIYIPTAIATALIMGIGLNYAPRTSIEEWALDEANARYDVLKAGGEVEFGKHYSLAGKARFPWVKEEIGESPKMGEPEDEEEEEEEE